jgi:hypothetical protein
VDRVSPLEVYNVVHGLPVQWSAFVEDICTIVSQSKIVPCVQWVEILKSQNESIADTLKDMPARKVHSVLEKLSWMERRTEYNDPQIMITKLTSTSPTLSEMPEIGSNMLET